METQCEAQPGHGSHFHVHHGSPNKKVMLFSSMFLAHIHTHAFLKVSLLYNNVGLNELPPTVGHEDCY